MSEDPLPDDPGNGPPPEPTASTPGEPTMADLNREIEQLRAQLAKANAEAAEYRRAAYEMLEQLDPYVPPTEDELHDMFHGPRGEPIRDILNELKRELGE